MSFAIYKPPGGQPIQIDAVRTQLLENRPLYDRRGTYLYNKVRIEIIGWYNPQLNAYQKNNTGVFTATVLPAIGLNTGPATWLALRDALCKPQGQLVLNLNDVEILRSPANGVPCDCNNGPFPVEPETVVEPFGKTLMIRFVVETYIREQPGTRGTLGAGGLTLANTSPLLSHTWEMTEDVNRDCFAVRAVKGRMVFRTDSLELNVIFPDAFRNWAFHPIPPRFQRENIEVVAEESGAQLEYSFQDVEKPFNIVSALTSRGVTNIESTTTIKATVMNGTDVAFGAMGLAGGISTSFAGSFSAAVGRTANQNFNIRQGNIRNAALGGAGAVGTTFNFLRSICPVAIKVTQVKVFGRRDTSRSLLSGVAHTVLANRTLFTIGPNPAPIARYSMDISETHDNIGEYVELTGQFLGSGLTSQMTPYGYPATWFYFNPNDEIFAVTDRQNVPIVTQSDGKSRGSYIAGVIAQILQSPDTTPPAPTNVAVGVNRTP